MEIKGIKIVLGTEKLKYEEKIKGSKQITGSRE